MSMLILVFRKKLLDVELKCVCFIFIRNNIKEILMSEHQKYSTKNM